MSKKYILHIITCCILATVTIPESVFSQDANSLIRVEYHLKYLKDTTENFYIEEPAELFISETQSYFNTTQKSTMDSIKFLDLDNAKYIRGKSQSLRVHKNFQTRTTTFYESFFSGEFLAVEEEQQLLDWKIQADTASMFGYICQKATLNYGGRDWTVWFTSDVPIPDGPYKFCGLPGLIVQMTDAKEQWFINFVSLTHLPNQDLNLFYLNEAEKISAKELKKQTADFKKNSFERLEASGIISVSAENRATMIQTSRENHKKYNNLIELYTQ